MRRFLALRNDAIALLLVTAAAFAALVAGAGARPSTDPTDPATNTKSSRFVPINLSAPTIAGTAAQGSTLTGSTGTWSGRSLTFTLGWQRCSTAGLSCEAITGASATTYGLTSADVGQTIRLLVVATNRWGEQTASSEPTAVVAPLPSAPPSPPPPPPPTPPSSTNPPTISGSAVVGETLNATTGSWSGTTPMTDAYQWTRCNSSGSSCTAVSGATSSAYQPTSADVGSTLRVAVTTTNSAGAASATSSATAAVTAPAPPPPPPPTTPSGLTVGLNGYPESGNTGEQNRLLAAGVPLIRTDRGDFGLAWAHSHGLKVDGIVWLNASSTGTGADVIELDNEPYYNNWNGLGGVEQWAQKARDVAKAIKAAYPGKPILLPSQSVTNNGDVLDNGTWTPMLYAINKAAPDIWQYVDGIAVHPYTAPAGPSAVSPALSHLRSELATIGGRAAGLPFWITEVGWTNTGSIAVSESTAASYMQQLIGDMQSRSDVAALIAYCTTDNPTDPNPAEQGYGAFRADGTAKPVMSVIKAG